MKRIIYILALAGAVLLSGCSKYFDRPEIQLLTKDKVKETPKLEAIESAIKTCYPLLGVTANALQNGTSNAWEEGYGFRPDIIIEDIAGGDMTVTWDERSDMYAWRQVESLRFTASTYVFQGHWSYQFEAISRANLALSYLEDPEIMGPVEITDALLNRYIGEMLFIRAYSYFVLATNFGDVPLMIKPLESFEEAYTAANREPVDVIWQQIDADLTRAAGLMPDSKYSSVEEPWRISKGAVLALMAKSALYREQYGNVLTHVASIKALGFDLNADWFQAFRTADEFMDNEVILQYEHTAHVNPTDPWNGNSILQFFAWGFFGVTDDLVAAFEDGDPRFHYTVDVDKRRTWKLMGATDDTYYGNSDSPVNRILIRYADVMLWEAEALILSGQVSEGVQIINKVRERARNSPPFPGKTTPAGALPARDINASQEQAFAWLQHERRVELAFECSRWSDIRRWGNGKEVFGTNYRDHYKLYPIPQSEIDKTGGTIIQNPGY